jgi:homoserine dehydrogenase
MPEPLRVALAGLGTVGGGVLRLLHEQRALIASRAGRDIRVTAVSARSRTRDRGADLSALAWESDPAALAGRNDIDVLVEVIGGAEGPALSAISAALKHNRHVVTANKALMARHGHGLALDAEARNLSLRFEAAVCGGIPVIGAVQAGLAGNRITRVMGVMNGTCNYILTRMESDGLAYAEALAEAQRLGYAEADPEFDVGGHDAAQKLSLLAATAFGTVPDYDGVAVEGISRVSLTDIAQARDMGFAIRLLGVARLTPEGLEQRMQPCLVPLHSPVGQLEGVTNLAIAEGDFVGPIVLTGAGAGAGPTASAVVSDLIAIARGQIGPVFGSPAAGLARPQRASAGTEAAYYLRFSLSDRPGALARVASVLGDQAISIDRMRQYSHRTEAAPVLIVTHECPRPALDRALAAIARLDVCLAAPVALRIEPI